MNKIRVFDTRHFAPFEETLRALPWYDIQGKAKPASVFDLEDYLGNVIKQVEKHRKDEGVDLDRFDRVEKELKAIKGMIARETV